MTFIQLKRDYDEMWLRVDQINCVKGATDSYCEVYLVGSEEALHSNEGAQAFLRRLKKAESP